MDCPKCGQTMVKGESRCWMCGFECSQSNGVNIKVLDYAQKALSHGKSDREIREKLKGLGVSDAEINRALAGARPKTAHERSKPQQGAKKFKERVIGVLKFDISVFDDIAENKPWGEIAALVLAGIFFNAIFMTAGLLVTPSPLTATSIIVFVCAYSAITLILIVPMYLIGSVVLNLFIRFLKGKTSWSATIAIYGYLGSWSLIMAPLSILNFIPPLNIIYLLLAAVISLAILSELALAISRVHQLSLGRAVAAMALTLFVIVIVAIALILGAFFTAIIFSAMPMQPSAGVA